MNIDTVFQCLKNLRINIAGLSEAAIKERVARCLEDAEIVFDTEVTFAPRCRADIFISGGIILELKKQRPRQADVEAQLLKYAQSGRIKGIILVLERHMAIPTEIEGIPCRVFSLNSRWGLAV